MWKDHDYYSKRDDDSAIGDSANNSAEEESGNPSRKSSDDNCTFDPHNKLSSKIGIKIPSCLLEKEEKQQTYPNTQPSYKKNSQNRVNNYSDSTSPSKIYSKSREESRKKSETDLQNKLHTLLSEMKNLRELDRDILRKFVTLNDCIEEVRWRLAENEAKFQRKLAEDDADEDFFSTLTESRLGDWDEFEKIPAQEEFQKKTTATPTAAISPTSPTYVETTQDGPPISPTLSSYTKSSLNSSAVSCKLSTYIETSQNDFTILPSLPSCIETSQNNSAVSPTSPSDTKSSLNGSAVLPTSSTSIETSQNGFAISSPYTKTNRSSSAISSSSFKYSEIDKNKSVSSCEGPKLTEVKQPQTKESSWTKQASVEVPAPSNKTSVDSNASEEAEKAQNKTKTNEREKVKDKDHYRIQSPHSSSSDVWASQAKEKGRQHKVSRRTSWRDETTTSTRRTSNQTPKSASVLAKKYNDLITQQKSSTLNTSSSLRSPTEDKAKPAPRRTQWPILEKQSAVKVSEFQKQREYQSLIGLSRVRNIGQVFQASNQDSTTKASDSSGSLNSMSSDSSSSLTSPPRGLATLGNSNKWSRFSSRTRSSTGQGPQNYNNNNNNVKGVVIVTTYHNTSTIDALPLRRTSNLMSRDSDVITVARKASSPNSIYNWISQPGDAPCL